MVIPRVNKAHGISTLSVTWYSENVNLLYHCKYISIIEAVRYSAFPTFCTSISIYYEERSRIFLNGGLSTAVYGLSFVVMWQLMSSTPVLQCRDVWVLTSVTCRWLSRSNWCHPLQYCTVSWCVSTEECGLSLVVMQQLMPSTLVVNGPMLWEWVLQSRWYRVDVQLCAGL